MSATIDHHLNSTQRPIGSLGDFAWESEDPTPMSLEPDAFDVAAGEQGSAHGLGGWLERARLNPHNPQLVADPLPHLNQTFSMGAQIAALCALTAVTVTGAPLGTNQPPSATVAGWGDAAQTRRDHPTMRSPEVIGYLQVAPSEDIHAIRALYDRFTAAFDDVPYLEASYRFSVDHETETPRLFLTLDTHGMDLSEVMRREMAVHDLIDQDPVLKAATKHHIITAV